MDRADQPRAAAGTALVVGATGFVGAAIARRAAALGWRVRLGVRRAGAASGLAVETGGAETVVGDLAGPVAWAALLDGVDFVVLAAGMAHQQPGGPEGPLFAVNAEAPARLAAAAASAGVARMILISSARAVAGPWSETIVTDEAAPAATDAYGRSKLAGEEAALSAHRGVAILRPAAVCGAGAKGYFGVMARLAATPLPLPVGGFAGRRSFVTDLNLADAAIFLAGDRGAAGRRFLIAEPEPWTAAAFVAALRAARGARPRTPALPRALARLLRHAPRLGAMIERLDRDLVVEAGALRALGWIPAEPASAGVARMARGG
jgi:UDP-glucose 4-epimerase